MLNKVRTIFILLLVFSFSATLMGNETVSKYFPATVGSSWVYEDQDGNEMTRRAIEGEEIAGETYHAFEYEPAFENWEDYEYYVHPSLFKIDDNGIKFFMDNSVVKAYKKRITKELNDSMEESRQRMPAEANYNPTFDVEVEIETQDHFNMLPISLTPNEEWDSMRIKPMIKVKINYTQNNSEVDTELAGQSNYTSFYFTILETGIIRGTENVETPAGTFKDCLKIEYRTETVLPKMFGANGPGAGESVSTLWLAPNVGIVKFRQEAQKPILQEMANADTTNQIKTFELKKYEIKTNIAESE